MTKLESKAIQAAWLLKIAYGLAVVVAGLDKFLNKITDWQMYISPKVIEITSVQPSTILMVSGVAEIIVGALILIKPRIGASIAIAWLAVIIFNLISMQAYYDIVVRDALLIVALVALILLDSAKA